VSLPLTGQQLKVRVGVPPQLSVPWQSGAAGTVLSAHVMIAGASGLAHAGLKVGGVLSWTAMPWLAVAVLPHVSVAVQVRTRVKSLAHFTDELLSLGTTFTRPPQLSLAVTVAAGGAEQFTVAFWGTPMSVGAVLS
jgi:hypothetical protein